MVAAKKIGALTPEILRRHLFDGRKVPFWDFNPRKLTSGVEIEYLIGRDGTTAPELATREDFMSVAQTMINQFSFRDLKLTDQPGRVSKDLAPGYVIIKPDFAWHILEISLPPCGNATELREILTTVLAQVDYALDKASLQRLDLSVLPSVPQKMELLGLNRLTDHTSLVNQPDGSTPTIDPYFPAYLAATHVHLNVSSEASLNFLPAMYQLEDISRQLYTRRSRFQGQVYDDIRAAFYANTLGQDYPLAAIPARIPRSVNDYVQAMNAARPLFPGDKFFPVRDMSFIRPTAIGTFEFRSACSFLNPETILEIAVWRKIQILAATDDDASLTSALQRCLSAANRLKAVGEDPLAIGAVVTRLSGLESMTGENSE